MGKLTFDTIRKDNLLLYEYVRGSTAYGTSLNSLSDKEKEANDVNATSDIDTSGVFIMPKEHLYGLGFDYQDVIADEKNDNVWNEIGKWMNLLCNSNPNVLESLWIPSRCILFENDLIKEIKGNRDLFLSKKIYDTFLGYARSQIIKMRGLNKAIVNPVNEKLSPLDFVYTFYKQGSTKIVNWLEYRGLKQRYCGLVNIPNMHNTYGLYYDFGTHIEVEYGGKDKFLDTINENRDAYLKIIQDYYDNKILPKDIEPIILFLMQLELYVAPSFYALSYERFKKELDKLVCYGFRGILNVDETSNELRLANVPFEAKPMCYVCYNQFGYNKHCGDYKRWNDWKRDRNPERYKLNLKQNYDLKNCYHMFRLIHMSQEILSGQGVFIDRTDIDRDFLIKVRLGKFEYDEIKEILEHDMALVEKAYNETKLKDDIDVNDVNQLLIDIRKKYYN